MMSLPVDLCGGSRVTVHRGPCMWLGAGTLGWVARGQCFWSQHRWFHGKNKQQMFTTTVIFSGWTNRQQFEESWMSLLGVLNPASPTGHPLSPEVGARLSLSLFASELQPGSHIRALANSLYFLLQWIDTGLLANSLYFYWSEFTQGFWQSISTGVSWLRAFGSLFLLEWVDTGLWPKNLLLFFDWFHMLVWFPKLCLRPSYCMFDFSISIFWFPQCVLSWCLMTVYVCFISSVWSLRYVEGMYIWFPLTVSVDGDICWQ